MPKGPTDDDYGRIAYEAYFTHSGGVSLASGDPLPSWTALKDSIRAAWIVSAKAVIGLYIAAQSIPGSAVRDDLSGGDARYGREDVA